uniref:Protein kinase domain-containing protein n=1 Tax=Tetradesmus obliquus TaxID=3088 RepID=A0A383WIW4_TETOB|eukprot:jgi/Sobl393_1/9876/SZX77162.1
MAGFRCFLLLLWCIINIIGEIAAAEEGQGTTAFVSQPLRDNTTTTLAAALKDQRVTRIVLLTNYTAEKDTWPNQQQLPGTYLAINRNVTITGAQGTQTVLDMAFKLSAAQLCGSCRLTVHNLTVTNERRGNGSPWDFFVGPAGSSKAAIIMKDIIRLRYGCTSANASIVVAAALKRPDWLPGSSSGLQEFRVEDVDFQGHMYPQSLVSLDYAADIPRTVQEGRGAFGGYAVWCLNVTQLCMRTVATACLETKSVDACVNDLIDQALAGGQSAQQQQQLPLGLLAAAIAVPLLIALLLALAAALFISRRRKQQQQQQLDALKQQQQRLLQQQDSAKQQLVTPGRKSGASVGGQYGTDADPEAGLLPGPVGAEGSASVLCQGPLAGGTGWQQACLTSPIVGSLDNQEVQFGKLLGQGSFGRVYRAYWAGREVAVKVIDHDSEAHAAVANEVELMLSFNHPNVVRALHCVTWTHVQKDDAAAAAASAAATAAAAAAAASQRSAGTPLTGTLGSSQQQQQPQLQQQCSGLTDSQMQQLEEQLREGTSAAQLQQLCDQLLGQGSQQQLPPVAGNSGPLLSQQQQQQQGLGQGMCAQPGLVAIGGSTSSSSSRSSGSSCAQRDRGGDTSVCGMLPTHGDQQQQQQLGAKGAAAAAAAVGGTSAGADTQHKHPDVQPASGGNQHSLMQQQQQQQQQQGTPAALANRSRCETWLVLEYCDCGTLHQIASEWLPGQECDEQMLERLLLLRDAAQGLAALHAKNVVHGDLNSRNVLVASSASSPCGMTAKLADLGLSRVLQQHATHRTTQTVGTMSHMPPELLRYGRMSTAVDIYAYGITMYQLYTGEEAFRNLHYGQFYNAIVVQGARPPVPPDMPSDYALLMQRCWAAEPGERPGISNLLQCLDPMIKERRKRLSIDDTSLPPPEHSQPTMAAAAQVVKVIMGAICKLNKRQAR